MTGGPGHSEGVQGEGGVAQHSGVVDLYIRSSQLIDCYLVQDLSVIII